MIDKSFYDKHGRQIHKGDLLKTFHFTGARRKKYFLYHTVVDREGVLYIVPTAELEPTCANQGGTCMVEAIIRSGADIEIISGYGPGDILNFEDRPTVRSSAATAA
jgi:hypothetical protein